MTDPAFASLLVHTVTVVRPATSLNAYNETVYDYGAGATRTAGVAARLQQDNRVETYPDGRQVGDQRWLMFTERQDLNRFDRVEWLEGDLTFEVEGPPEPTYGATAGFHHLEATLRVVEG